ncbi:hypothetical protein DMB65_17200 [Flavobacterium cheongpyeongense]|uniref:Uncharacterized protein n=1 Tax=Flavobacterium cheongpyeongense TaxID=2212651 RepID=A0A2V4BKR2_9FLAO|nr:hypothetical protein [Flavobacterium cheongpyeongense]PXY39556.1 hypothetical protein DMB65_17200 [Flavobacterium cheongpyeongense]
MSNITIEDYKKAIRAKYEIAIKEDVSGILSDPTPAQLRDFYLRIFEKGLGSIDEEIVKIFLEAKENFSLKKSIENFNIGKFKPIISFLKGGNTDNRPRIEMAAILVDFYPRPFNKFKSKDASEDIKTKELYFLKDEKKEKERNHNEEENLNQENVTKILDDVFEAEPINLFLDLKKELPEKETQKAKKNVLIVVTGVIGLFFLGYYFPQKKQCMQWSGDHYEEVSCDLEIQGIGTYISVEPLDERVIHLKKIKVSDTTTFFKNGEAVIWYAKVEEGVEFFNSHGMHPENNKPLKPVTQYIIDKYVK